MGLLTRARSVETGSGRPGHAPRSAATGLLARSRQYRGAGAATLFRAEIPQEELEQARARRAAPGAPPPLSRQDLLSALQHIPEGLTAPGQVFAVLQEHLALTRGALLLFDPARSVFAPWASHGLDETTLHRLRIPFDAGGTLDRLETGEILLLTDPQQREDLRRYFSTREHATMQTLLLVPFVHHNRLIAVLLATQARRALDQPLLEALGAAAPQAAALLDGSREAYAPGAYAARTSASGEQRLESPAQQSVDRPDAVRERVLGAAKTAASRGNRLALIRVSLESVARTLSEHSPLADPFRLREDLQRIILSLFRPLGSVLQLDPQRLLLVVNAVKEPDSALLTAHLRAALQALVPQLADAGPVDLLEAARLCAPSPEETGTCLAELV